MPDEDFRRSTTEQKFARDYAKFDDDENTDLSNVHQSGWILFGYVMKIAIANK